MPKIIQVINSNLASIVTIKIKNLAKKLVNGGIAAIISKRITKWKVISLL